MLGTDSLQSPWFLSQFTDVKEEPVRQKKRRRAAPGPAPPAVGDTMQSLPLPDLAPQVYTDVKRSALLGEDGLCNTFYNGDGGAPHHVDSTWYTRSQMGKSEAEGGAGAGQTRFGRALLNAVEGYHDLMYPLRDWDKETMIIEANVMHTLSHVWRCRERIVRNNAHLQKSGTDLDDVDTDEFRDQGFLKPTVLIILPMRNICLKYMEKLVELWGGSEVGNWQRFIDDFSELDQEKDKKFHRRTPDYKRQFEGNIDDRFCFGVTVRPKKLHVFSTFAQSDIIFASPLGIASTLKKNEAQGADFLSSIEVSIFDQLDCLLLQNFEYTQQTFDALNKMPENMRDCADINRTKRWLLDNEGSKFRQTLMYSRFPAAEFVKIFSRTLHNRRGKIRCGRNYNGELVRVVNGAKHLFHRFEVTSVENSPDERFKFFEDKVYSRLTSAMNSGVGTMSTIIIVPSYFDYTRVRNFFDSVDRDCFTEVCEYTPVKEMHFAIKEFNERKRSFLLMTERFYFFRRYVLSTAKSIIFYQLPQCTHFYHELVNSIRTDESPTVLTLFCKYDAYQAVRVVGTERFKRLQTSDGATHMFC
eukprot:TRINITY_DN14947_c3_g1_i2.p1 TRINITY_DN14947_c3_g1~~TRINITY_DN14947_c3_g1_i2.p1  ORF type:complete len:603 (+),score=223.43 TRINITY_DN14947_c3_g1_i2:58-1809(+)